MCAFVRVTINHIIIIKETFAPVIRFESLRMLLAVAAHKRMAMTQFDVKTAFLNGTIEEEIYMSQPEGFEDGTNRVCRLIKGLYGLKQSPRAWNHEAGQVSARTRTEAAQV